MKMLLPLLLASIVGCAVKTELPEVGDQFAEYKTETLALEEAIEYPEFQLQGPIEHGGERVWYVRESELAKFDQYTMAASENKDSIERLVGIVRNVEEERDELLNACVALEQRAKVYRSAYVNEIEASRWNMLQSIGLGSLIVLLGITI